MSHQCRILKVHMVWPHYYFVSLARLNYVKVSPSVLGAVERHSATRHPAQCTSLCWSFYGLWLEFITSLRDSDYKTLVTTLTEAHVISALVFKHSGVCGLYMASYCARLVLCDWPTLKCEEKWDDTRKAVVQDVLHLLVTYKSCCLRVSQVQIWPQS